MKPGEIMAAIEPKQEPSKKTSSPYDLTSTDFPGNIIIAWRKWGTCCTDFIAGRRKWGFINGTIKQPAEESLELEDWWTIQSLWVSWIMNTIEPNL